MDVVPVGEHNIHGLVVPVDTDGSDGRHRLRASASLQVPKAPARPATTSSEALIGQMHLGGSEHKLIGSPDEHYILTTAGGQRAAQLLRERAALTKPRFSGIISDYAGACFEDNCNIGKTQFIILLYQLGTLSLSCSQYSQTIC